MDEPPGAAVKDRRGCVASIDRVCGIPLGILHEWEEEPIRREGRSPLLSFRPTVSFPAVASRPNAQTTRTTPSAGRRKRRLTSVHLDFHLLPSGFPAKTHTPLHSSLSPNTQRGDWTERERDRFLGDRRHHWQSADQKRRREEERGPRGGEEDIRNSMMYKLRCIVQII